MQSKLPIAQSCLHLQDAYPNLFHTHRRTFYHLISEQTRLKVFKMLLSLLSILRFLSSL